MIIKPPPIAVWLFSIAVFLLCEVFIYKNHNAKKRLERRVSYEINAAENYLKDKKDGVKLVVAIGSSLSGNGLLHGSDFAKNSLSKFGKDIYLLVITSAFDPGETLLKQLSLVEKVLPLKPDLFLVQMELAAIDIDFKENASFPNYHPLLVEISAANSDFLKLGFLGEKIDRKLNIPDKNMLVNQDTLRYENFIAEREIKRENAYLIDAFKSLKEAQIKTMIYGIPQPYTKEQKIYSKTFKHKLDSTLNFYKNSFQTDFVYYDGPRMYYRLFVDGGHLNNEGAKLYTDWLNKELIKRLYQE